jgi:phosphate acetyltransferase
MDTLSRGSAAVFRPIVAGAGPDPLIDLVRRGCAESPADACGLPRAEARELLANGASKRLLETVMTKFRALSKGKGFVLSLPADLPGTNPVQDFRLHVDIAANLGCPAIVAACGAGRSPEDVEDLLRGTWDALAEYGVEIPATLVTDLDGNGMQRLRDHLGKIKTPHPVYLLPPLDIPDPKAAVAAFKAGVDGNALAAALEAPRAPRTTPLLFEMDLMDRAREKRMRIVLAEGLEERILRATDSLLHSDVADIILLGDVDAIRGKAASLKLDIAKATLIDPAKAKNFDDYANTYHELRKAKGVTPEAARTAMADPTYYGTMMVKKDDADGMVSGSINTTAHTIRPSFEFVKTKPGFSVVSSVFLMCLKDRVLVFGDCAVNPNPTSQQLAEIAVASARTAKVFGIEPRVAMLSYSTGTSGKGPDVDLVVEATKLAKEMAPDLAIDGPIQYDAAIDPGVARTKLPNSPVAGKATVFIFPDLNTGNNTYKAVQRAADALAVGPVLQGLNKPVNDLSRGCTVADIVNTVAITAVQAAAEK